MRGFKASETLLGIETNQDLCLSHFDSLLQSLWNPFRDWNTFWGATEGDRHESLQSLWNPFRDWNKKAQGLGIVLDEASKPLKPF